MVFEYSAVYACQTPYNADLLQYLGILLWDFSCWFPYISFLSSSEYREPKISFPGNKNSYAPKYCEPLEFFSLY